MTALAADGTPEVTNTTVSSPSVGPGGSVILTATATAYPCPAGGCVSGSGVIFFVALRIDQAFWAVWPDGAFHAMEASDGAFGEAVEEVTGIISASDLHDGVNTICVVAVQDRHGNAGGEFGCATVTMGNEPPSDITLSYSYVDEHLPAGAVVGGFTTTDPDSFDRFTYALVTGTGDTDNAAFRISGDILETDAEFDFATKSTYEVRIRTTDLGGEFFEKPFTITVNSQRVGTVTDLTGVVTILRPDGTRVTAVIGASVALGDTIETGAGAGAAVSLIDGSSLTLSENTVLLIDEFAYDPQTQSGSSFYSLLQGFFVYISGFIGSDPPDSERIDTPVGCICIRGTELIAGYDPGSGTARADLISGRIAIIPKLADPSGEFDAPRSISFNASGVLGSDPLSQEAYDVLKAAILARLEDANAAPTAAANGPYIVTEGSSVVLAGSGSDADGDPLTYAWDLDDDGTFETPGQSVTFSAAGMPAPGIHSVALQVSDDGGLTAVAATTVTVTYAFRGFLQPVDNLPIANGVTAGQGVPVKFSLGGDHGLLVFAPGFPKTAAVTCESTDLVDGIETTSSAGSSSLSYDASTDTYTYLWKTAKAWRGTCRQLVLELADGTIHRANFTFKK